MSKLLLMSLLLATVAIPISAAKDSNAHRGLKRALVYMFAFNLFYLFAVRVIYPRL